jgi:hypothetical protein
VIENYLPSKKQTSQTLCQKLLRCFLWETSVDITHHPHSDLIVLIDINLGLGHNY